MKSITMIIILLAHNALGWAQQSQQRTEGFRIDQTKPYVYIQVVAVSPRKPIEVGEPNVGIKLRLVNNSRVPISIVTFGSEADRAKGEYQVMDEVIPDPWLGRGEEAGIGATIIPQGEKELSDIVRWPNQTEREIEAAAASTRQAVAKTTSVRPNGYNDQHSLGRKYLTIIRPGESASFSYPKNHISETWHLEVPFRLALESNGTDRPPYSHVALYWNDLSKSARSDFQGVANGRSK
jgi:hypothetical protein